MNTQPVVECLTPQSESEYPWTGAREAWYRSPTFGASAARPGQRGPPAAARRVVSRAADEVLYVHFPHSYSLTPVVSAV